MIKVITDSSSNITAQEAEEWGITLLPLTLIFGDKQYRDGLDISADEFYKKLVSSKEFPHTAQISEDQLVEAYTECCADGSEVIVLPIAGAISGSYSLAQTIASRPEFSRVTVYDTKCTTIMLKFLVKYAAEHKNEPCEKVCKGLDKLRKHIKLYACLDTLEYLKKGGRLSTATATIGELFKIKPVITVNEKGEIDMIGKALGMHRGIKTITDLFKADEIEGDPTFIYTMDDTNAKDLAKKCGEKIKNFIYENMCPVIGAHIGPATCGIVYVTKG